MLIHKLGNILDATENVICHQVNIQGVMGGGLAYQIATIHPKVENEYIKYCQLFENRNQLIGTCQTVLIQEHKYIANCFTQQSNFNTDYVAIKKVFSSLLENCKESNLTICIPFKYGAGIANGNWSIIEKIFENLSNKYKIDISVYHFNE